MPSFSDWLLGSPDKLKKIDTGTKAQQQFGGTDLISMLQQLMGQGGGQQLANQYDQNLLKGGPGDQGAYDQFSQPYLQQFQEQIAPRIAEQFAGAGALSSSGFGQALGGAGAGLQSQLAELFSSLQQGAAGRQQNQFGNLSQLGLGYQPFAYQQKEGSAGMLGPLATGLGTALAGPLGGLAAGGISSLFNKSSGVSKGGIASKGSSSAMLAALLGGP
jgi:hypothetical protein